MIKSVKSDVADKDTKKYPCLKEYKIGHFIVLFTDKRIGTVVHSEKGKGVWSVGYVSETWGEENFTLYEGTITLTND